MYTEDFKNSTVRKQTTQLKVGRDFPGGPVAKTPHSQCRGPRFNPLSENLIPHAATKDPACHNKDPRCRN